MCRSRIQQTQEGVLAPLGTNVVNRILGMDTRWDFLKGKYWIHKGEQMEFHSEHVLKHFCEHWVWKGNNQNFSNLNPKMTEVFFEKSGSNSSKRANDVPIRTRAQTFLRAQSPKGKRSRFLKSEPKSDESFFFEIFFYGFENTSRSPDSVLWNLSW